MAFSALARETIEVARVYLWLNLYHNASNSERQFGVFLLACLIESLYNWLNLAFSEPVFDLARKVYRKYIEFITPQEYKRHIVPLQTPLQALQPPFEEALNLENSSNGTASHSDNESPLLSSEEKAYSPGEFKLSEEDANRIFELFTALSTHQRIYKSLTPVSTSSNSPRSRPASPIQSYPLPRVHGCKPYVQRPVTLEPIEEEHSRRSFFSRGCISTLNLGSPSFIAERSK
ncbi:hypothetical protein TRVA0_012S01794 [Trichomonascus vanleenenianus]|uniref:uncharacterized protein n=1 Tax=Trichomonascus vanleenenianus TaxID=2268995 RepID=UPI003EC9CBA4